MNKTHSGRAGNLLSGKNTLLGLALISLAVGLSHAAQNTIFYLGLPIGVILFGLFPFAQALEKGPAVYDEQNRAAEFAALSSEARRNNLPFHREVAHHPVPTKANPH